MGWASVGIGLSELLLSKKVQDLLGIDDRRAHVGILRVMGVRELMHGVGILAARRPAQLARGVQSRVAGDMLDNALLAVAASKTKRPAKFAAVAATVAIIGLADAAVALKLR